MPPRAARRDALRRLLLASGLPLTASFGACALNDAPRSDFHLLRDAGASPPPRAAGPLDQTLLVDVAASPTLYNSDHMVFSADGRSRAYFQFAQWSERPSRSLARLAETRLAEAKVFRAVAPGNSGVRGDLLLTLRLDELFLDDSRQPPQAHLAFTATLIDWRGRRLLSRRAFAAEVQAPTRDAAGMTAASSQAVGRLLDELVTWVAASTAPT